MSFLDNPKNAGTAMFIAGLLTIIIGVVDLVLDVTDSDGIQLGFTIASIGYIIAGFIFFGLGKSVRAGEISDKWDILTRFCYTIAIVTIIEGIFSVVASVGTAILDIILGLIILWVYKKMTDGKATTVDKIIWIILVIVFLLGIIGGILEILTISLTSILGICDVIIYAFMLIAALDKDCKAKMGM